MRWADLLFCCLLLGFTLTGAAAPAFASDLNAPRETHAGKGPPAGEAPKEIDVDDFCYEQRRICRKVCNLHSNFNDRFDGCPQSCDSRETRCISTGCFRWTDPDFLIAERFGGYKCAQ